MKIQLVSDLHLEFADINIQNQNNADVLILSGDIMIAEDLHNHPEPASPYPPEIIRTLGSRQQAAKRYRDFLKRVSFQFPHVIYVAGNHEFYHGKFLGSLKDLKNECGKFPNVYFLEDECRTINDVTFIGCTLWTDMNKGDPLTLHAVADMMNDYRIIRNDEKGFTKLRPAHTAWRHARSVGYIKSVIEGKHDKKFVVAGHMAPSGLSIAQEYINDTLMNGAYCSDLSEFILDHPQIKFWTHGHMHQNFNYEIGSTRIICNPRGYYDENPNFNPNLTFEI